MGFHGDVAAVWLIAKTICELGPSCKTALADEQVIAGKCERCSDSR